jgi:hypothetical protein
MIKPKVDAHALAHGTTGISEFGELLHEVLVYMAPPEIWGLDEETLARLRDMMHQMISIERKAMDENHNWKASYEGLANAVLSYQGAYEQFQVEKRTEVKTLKAENEWLKAKIDHALKLLSLDMTDTNKVCIEEILNQALNPQKIEETKDETQ